MTTTDDLIAAIGDQGEQLALSAAAAGLDAPVPTCPDWDVRALVRHVGGVHRWATGYIVDRRREPWDVDLHEVVGEWPPDPQLLDWFRAGFATLERALADAPDDLECFTFLRASSPKAMWSRRQAHETAIHRADADAAAGLAPVYPAWLAADGIDELLDAFVTRPGRGPRTDDLRPLMVSTADTDDHWHVSISAGDVVTTRAPLKAACTVSGPASSIYLLLWNRRGPEGLLVEGDERLLDLWREQVQITWS